MFYLFIQTGLWILAAFILGLMIGWWLSRRCACKQTSIIPNTITTTEPVASPDIVKTPEFTGPSMVTEATTEIKNPVAIPDSYKPMGLASAPENPDELKRIKGIGKVIEEKLNTIGIYTFKQIVELSPENIDWLNDNLNFPGRIEREEWQKQAKQLDAGQETDFSKRVDKGDVSY